MNNVKNLIALVISVFFIAVALFYFLVPAPQLSGLKGTKSDFETKAATIEMQNSNKLSLSTQIADLSMEVNKLENNLEKSNESAQKSDELFQEIMKDLDADDWRLHIPSLLIELEQAAVDRGLKIAIDYNSLKSEGDYVSSSGQGLKVLDATVELRGEYHFVQDYIKFVEDIDFVNVEELVLNRTGNGELEGSYVLSIYHIGD